MGEGVAFIADHTDADDECFTVIAWETQRDVDNFNQMYNVNLVLPRGS